MKLVAHCLALAALCAGGCARGTPAVIDPGAPRVEVGTGNVDRSPVGWLLVHTTTYVSHADDVVRELHRGYDLFDGDGRWIRRVDNHTSFSDEAPTRVALPPGTYLIRLDASGTPPTTLSASIEANRLTEIDTAKAPGAPAPR